MITDQGGLRFATSVGGTLTGRGGTSSRALKAKAWWYVEQFGKNERRVGGFDAGDVGYCCGPPVWGEKTKSKPGQLLERDWLDRRPDPVVADLRRRDPTLVRDDLGDGEAAKAALTGPCRKPEGFGLIGSRAAECDEMAQLAGRDFLAAAGDHVVGRHAMLELGR